MKNRIELTHQSIETDSMLEFISHPDAGGEVLFVGTTRRKTKVREDEETVTEYLIYEAFETMAIREMERLVDQAAARWPILGVAIVHRLGKVVPQEASIAIAVSAPHRAEAFEAARWLIDMIKQNVPIWKQENYLGSSSEWVHPSTPPDDQRLAPLVTRSAKNFGNAGKAE